MLSYKATIKIRTILKHDLRVEKFLTFPPVQLNELTVREKCVMNDNLNVGKSVYAQELFIASDRLKAFDWLNRYIFNI